MTPSKVSDPSVDPQKREEVSAPPGSDPGPASVSRAAWIFGLAAGIGVAAAGFTALSFFEPGKILQVVLEMATVAAALLMTTRIWSASADAHGEGVDSPPGPTDRKPMGGDRHDA